MRGLNKNPHPMAQTDRQTSRQTDGHGDSMTNSAQRGRAGENYDSIFSNTFSNRYEKRGYETFKEIPFETSTGVRNKDFQKHLTQRGLTYIMKRKINRA